MPQRGLLQRTRFSTYAAIAVLLIASGALAELAMGRLPISKSGHVHFWVGAADHAETSQQIADWYSFSHIIHGFALYGMVIRDNLTLNIIMLIHPFDAIRRWQMGG